MKKNIIIVSIVIVCIGLCIGCFFIGLSLNNKSNSVQETNLNKVEPPKTSNTEDNKKDYNITSDNININSQYYSNIKNHSNDIIKKINDVLDTDVIYENTTFKYGQYYVEYGDIGKLKITLYYNEEQKFDGIQIHSKNKTKDVSNAKLIAVKLNEFNFSDEEINKIIPYISGESHGTIGVGKCSVMNFSDDSIFMINIM